MDDLISRRAALDEVRSYYDSEYVVPNPKSIEERIEDLPSAQPEIVYCKDCVKHEQKGIWKEARNRMELCPLAIFRGAAQAHEFDYQFCCYGKRKGE